MNFKLVFLVLVVMLSAVLGMPQYFGKKRKFPGQRLRGKTNYGTHSFGGNGYSDTPVSRSRDDKEFFRRRKRFF